MRSEIQGDGDTNDASTKEILNALERGENSRLAAKHRRQERAGGHADPRIVESKASKYTDKLNE